MTKKTSFSSAAAETSPRPVKRANSTVGSAVLFTVPESGHVVPAVVVEIDKSGVASLQVFRTSGDGTYLIRNIAPGSGEKGTYQ